MGSAVRLFMFGDRDELYRLPTARYERMLRRPDAHPIASCANRRVRCAQAVVQLEARRVVRVVRFVFWNAEFDERGVLDTAALGRQSVARLDAVLGQALPRERAVKVVDASARFVARGGDWKPTSEQTEALRRAALGERRCKVVPQ